MISFVKELNQDFTRKYDDVLKHQYYLNGDINKLNTCNIYAGNEKSIKIKEVKQSIDCLKYSLSQLEKLLNVDTIEDIENEEIPF